ncbi:hypothetical protein ACHBGB_005405, partial [Klebsiella pneumoniae]
RTTIKSIHREIDVIFKKQVVCIAQHSIIFLLTLIAKTSINQKRNSFFISGHQKTTQLISIRTPLC